MLVQGAVGSNACSCRFRVFESHLGLSDSFLIVDAGFNQSASQDERLSIGLNGPVVHILERILPAELEVILRESGLLRETLVFKIRGAHLSGVLKLVHRVTDA